MATFGRHSMITAHLLKPVIIYSFKVKRNRPDGHRFESVVIYRGRQLRGKKDDFGESS